MKLKIGALLAIAALGCGEKKARTDEGPVATSKESAPPAKEPTP